MPSSIVVLVLFETLRVAPEVQLHPGGSLNGVAEAAIIFDGDDTLWLVEHLYDDARADAAVVVAAAGIDPVRWEVLEREIDVRNVERMGVSALRFPTSCVEAYVVASNEQGTLPRADVSDQVRTAAATVFDRPAPVVEGAEDVVEQLRSQYFVALLTKGEPWVQRRRIAESGLDDAFDLVSIVESKAETEFTRVLGDFGVTPARSWSVGNSLASDINPALALGMSAVWIDAHVWEHERRELEPVNGNLLVGRSLIEVPDLIAAGARGAGSPIGR